MRPLNRKKSGKSNPSGRSTPRTACLTSKGSYLRAALSDLISLDRTIPQRKKENIPG